jgi:hypothetical protein
LAKDWRYLLRKVEEGIEIGRWDGLLRSMGSILRCLCSANLGDLDKVGILERRKMTYDTDLTLFEFERASDLGHVSDTSTSIYSVPVGKCEYTDERSISWEPCVVSIGEGRVIIGECAFSD